GLPSQPVTRLLVRSYRHLFTLTPASRPWRYTFCCTFPVLRPPCGELGRWALPTTASSGARTFLPPLPPRCPRGHGRRPPGQPTGPSTNSTHPGYLVSLFLKCGAEKGRSFVLSGRIPQPYNGHHERRKVHQRPSA